MRSILYSLLSVVAASVVFQPVVAQAGVLDFFFPSLKEEEYDPSKNMVAEFAKDSAAVDKEQLDKLPVDAIPLVNPHLINQEVGQWIMTVVGESMNLEAGAGTPAFEKKTDLFNATAKQQFVTFLTDNNIVKVLNTGRINIRSYVNAQPLLLNEGVVADRYRWLFRVPVVVTYMDKDMNSYKGKQEKAIHKAVVNVQVGRVGGEDFPDGLQVEQWSGRLEHFEKPKSSP